VSDGDYFDIDGKVDDRIEGLWRVLGDPNLGRDVKVAEIASVCRRIDTLEGQRETATSLSVIADALAARGGDV
jgi:hypothetical protein